MQYTSGMSFPDIPRLLQTSICSILFLTSACSLLPQAEQSLQDNTADAVQLAATLSTTDEPIQDNASQAELTLLASTKPIHADAGRIVQTLAASDSGSLHNIPEQDIEQTHAVPVPNLNLTEGQASSNEPAAEPWNPDIWSRIRTGFRLDHHLAERRVKQQLNWFINNPDYLQRVIKRSEPYLYYIVESLSASNMPLELSLLPIVESAFDPFAYSHGRASGLWQFIPSTAHLYGIRIDWWYDGRRDLIDSTSAAIDFLEDLHQHFDGDWELALASYNSGMGMVGKAIRSNKKQLKPANFWYLKLPRETQSYVPKLLALSAIINDPEHYNIQLPSLANQAYLTTVDIKAQIDLALAADLADIDLDRLYRLNPGYNQWATHPDGPHRLVLPVKQAGNFEAHLKQLPDASRVSWKRHIIKTGENLGSIAHQYGVNVSTIKQTNHLSGDMIRAGRTLLIPSAIAENYAMSINGRADNREDYYRKRFGTEPTLYRVSAGDSLWSIAMQFNVSIRSLAKWNGIGTNGILPQGKEMKIFIPGTNRQKPKSPEKLRTIRYKVRKGDSLSRIASKFRVTVASIKSWNEKIRNSTYIQPGDQITIIVDVTASL
ncbi:MAG: LysM peptidoglycan-binding domain-containing protein [Gammaproteobacteria bacterium]|nr:LysM peptidoglycan-binding domain-containing protein [Gammaproteobacteria bacterium]